MGTWFVKGEVLLANVLLVIIVGLVFAAGILRWFGHPLVWSVDLAQLLFVWVSFLGADLALRKRAHIGIDYLVRRLPARAHVVLDIVLSLVAMAFLLAMVGLGYQLTMLNLERLYGDSGISYGFVTIAVPAGCLLLSSTLIQQVIRALRSLKDVPQPIFAAEAKEEVIP
jgi:TRAP-type C4-dicarboxylate transport system permease small subunit